MITCMIVDDEPMAVELLENHIQQLPELQLVHKCFSPLEALARLREQPVDIIFLDINMPRMSGMELAGLLPAGQSLIFTTAYSEYAVQSYDTGAVDYLLKPVTLPRFIKAVQKAIAGLNKQTGITRNNENNTIFLKTGKTIIPVRLGEVSIIEGLKDYVLVHMHGKKIPIHKRMKDMEELLPAFFSRIHLSYIINRNYINRIENNQVYISEQVLPVGEKYREHFLAKVNGNSL